MALANRLRERGPAIVRRWLEEILATYPRDAAVRFGREKDRFANPVGHALRTGTQAAFQSLLDGKDPEAACADLEDVIRIRALQAFSPSQAVSFVFRLKGAVRAELGEDAWGPELGPELAQWEEQVDRIALAAFDIYARCREQVCQLRVNEVKRSVARFVERMNLTGPGQEGGEG